MFDIALIVLNYNSADDTINCVEKLQSFHGSYHIVVVDNCSPDNSFQVIKEKLKKVPNVEVIQSPSNGGYSAGNNFGMQYAIQKYSPKILGILNPDVIIPDKRVIDAMAELLMSQKDIGVVGGATVYPDSDFKLECACWDIPSVKELILGQSLLTKIREKPAHVTYLNNNTIEADCVAGCYFLAKTSVMQKIGFLDDNVFLYNEEIILGIKCKMARYRVLVALDQKYIHNHRYDVHKKVSFLKKVQTTHAGYVSRKYLCEKYYSKKYVPLLWVVEQANKLYLIGAYVAGKMRRK